MYYVSLDCLQNHCRPLSTFGIISSSQTHQGCSHFGRNRNHIWQVIKTTHAVLLSVHWLDYRLHTRIHCLAGASFDVWRNNLRRGHHDDDIRHVSCEDCVGSSRASCRNKTVPLTQLRRTSHQSLICKRFFPCLLSSRILFVSVVPETDPQLNLAMCIFHTPCFVVRLSLLSSFYAAPSNSRADETSGPFLLGQHSASSFPATLRRACHHKEQIVHTRVRF